MRLGVLFRQSVDQRRNGVHLLQLGLGLSPRNDLNTYLVKGQALGGNSVYRSRYGSGHPDHHSYHLLSAPSLTV